LVFNAAVLSSGRGARFHPGAFLGSFYLPSAPRRKVASKIFGLYPAIRRFREDRKENWYYTLLMSTGLTFGTISALYGLSHQIITQAQYSLIVGAVIASAVIPTLIANKFFLPAHLLEKPLLDDQAPDEKDIQNRL
jgi:Kef-type K+ transport system membrane component KefB